MHSFDVTAIKACSISADGSLVTLTLVTKYVGDMGITLPIECLKTLPVPLPAAPPANGQNAVYEAPTTPNTTPNQITVSVANTWLTAADNKRGVVVVVMDPNTPKHIGFAVKQSAARQLGAAIVKQADAIDAAKATPSAN
jgi:hypothetical protein